MPGTIYTYEIRQKRYWARLDLDKIRAALRAAGFEMLGGYTDLGRGYFETEIVAVDHQPFPSLSIEGGSVKRLGSRTVTDEEITE